MKKINSLLLALLVASCGGGNSDSTPQLPDPLSMSDPLLEKTPPITRIKTANPSRPYDLYGAGRNFSVWPVLEIVQFEPRGDAENSIEIDYLLVRCKMEDGSDSVLVAGSAAYSVGYLQEAILETTSTDTTLVRPKEQTSYLVLTGEGGSGYLPTKASDRPTTCWTEAKVKLSGRIAVRATTHYLNFVDFYTRTPVVMGNSDWRTSKGQWLLLRTDD